MDKLLCVDSLLNPACGSAPTNREDICQPMTSSNAMLSVSTTWIVTLRLGIGMMSICIEVRGICSDPHGYEDTVAVRISPQ